MAAHVPPATKYRRSIVLRASRAAAPALVRLEDADEGRELHAKPNNINEDKEEYDFLDARRACNDDMVFVVDVGIHFMLDLFTSFLLESIC